MVCGSVGGSVEEGFWPRYAMEILKRQSVARAGWRGFQGEQS